MYRSNHPEMFFQNGLLKIFTKFTDKQLCWSLFFEMKLQASNRESNTDVFLQILRNFYKHHFLEHLWTTVSECKKLGVTYKTIRKRVTMSNHLYRGFCVRFVYLWQETSNYKTKFFSLNPFILILFLKSVLKATSKRNLQEGYRALYWPETTGIITDVSFNQSHIHKDLLF